MFMCTWLKAMKGTVLDSGAYMLVHFGGLTWDALLGTFSCAAKRNARQWSGSEVGRMHHGGGSLGERGEDEKLTFRTKGVGFRGKAVFNAMREN